MAVVGLTVPLSFFSFLLLLPLFIASASASRPPPPKTPSAFDFLNHLKGCHRGDNIKDVNKLKQYLEMFGYLHYNQSDPRNHAKDDEFDDLLEAAVKAYQKKYHLNVTGALDSETVSTMAMPRCGVPDIDNGTNSMHHRGHGAFHMVSHYRFMDGNPRWPSTKYTLTYGFAAGTPAAAVNAVRRAFSKWSSTTHFRFTQVQNFNAADLKISFARGAHNDNSPFDGRGGVIAHAYQPTIGVFHYDADEQWSDGAVRNAFDLETVALHEIGHLLGLGHSDVADAIMYASIASGITKNLHADDIQGIKALYNM